jgi:hypothetical protein
MLLMLFPRSSPKASYNTFSLKNVGIKTSCSRLSERLAAQQESSAILAEQVDQLKRKAENTDREFKKFKKQQQEEYNKLYEHIMLLSAGNLSLVDAVNMWFVCYFDVIFWWLDM